MSDHQTDRLSAVIHGRVQGVGYRAFAARSARELGLTGWVRNRFNGTVETVAEGTRPRLENYLRDLKRGPGPSNVTQIDEDWSPATKEFNQFKIRMTR
ncbi:MAG: acylphosphatase [Gammaproteobacteria bacterium]|nr:acylphosphatase [Gammaproteobacteria bacterium]